MIHIFIPLNILRQKFQKGLFVRKGRNSAQLSLFLAWLSLAEGGGYPQFFLSSSWANPRLHTENQLYIMP